MSILGAIFFTICGSGQMQSWAGYEKPPDDDEDVDVKIQKTISMESLKENTNIVDTNENLK